MARAGRLGKRSRRILAPPLPHKHIPGKRPVGVSPQDQREHQLHHRRDRRDGKEVRDIGERVRHAGAAGEAWRGIIRCVDRCNHGGQALPVPRQDCIQPRLRLDATGNRDTGLQARRIGRQQCHRHRFTEFPQTLPDPCVDRLEVGAPRPDVLVRIAEHALVFDEQPVEAPEKGLARRIAPGDLGGDRRRLSRLFANDPGDRPKAAATPRDAGGLDLALRLLCKIALDRADCRQDASSLRRCFRLASDMDAKGGAMLLQLEFRYILEHQPGIGRGEQARPHRKHRSQADGDRTQMTACRGRRTPLDRQPVDREGHHHRACRKHAGLRIGPPSSRTDDVRNRQRQHQRAQQRQQWQRDLRQRRKAALRQTRRGVRFNGSCTVVLHACILIPT